MSNLHKFECTLYIAISLVVATICCFSAVSTDDWLKTVLLIAVALIAFYYSVNSIFYMVKKTILDSVAEE